MAFKGKIKRSQNKSSRGRPFNKDKKGSMKSKFNKKRPFNDRKDRDGGRFSKDNNDKSPGRSNFNKKKPFNNRNDRVGGDFSEDNDKAPGKKRFVSEKKKKKNQGVHYKDKKFDKSKKPNSKKGSKQQEEEDEAEIETVAQDYILNPLTSERLVTQDTHDNYESDADDQEIVNMMTAAKKKSKTGGGFKSMGLSQPLLRAVIKKGYKVPTPIQRKSIPLLLEGRDVVGMARTGSGKTAAFLLPLLEKLKARNPAKPIRGLIMSPTRELALQTHKFARELGRFTDLKTVCLVGGESMERQFTTIHENPDIVIATPGRFLHLCVEMNMRLKNVEYLVFDEADRLFELGFQEQLQDILNRLPENRQTVLFSATLPQLLVDFAKAGLSDPELIRLDVESKLSENLRTVYLNCRTEDKTAILLHILRNVIQPKEMTVVFVATRHHVEYLKDILNQAQIPCCYVYSSLDPEARNLNVSKFQEKRVRVLLVTDVAARGIDIPLLDNVINYNFPAKPKLFVHRVGRVARAGRTGTAYSLVGPDEVPFLYDLHLFLDRKVKLSKEDSSPDEDGLFGAVPQSVIDDEADSLARWHETNIDFENMKRVCANAMKQYMKARPQPSPESVQKMKHLMGSAVPFHPLFQVTAIRPNAQVEDSSTKELENARDHFLQAMKTFKPPTTIFEIGDVKKSRTTAFEVMQTKRKIHDKIVEKRLQSEGASNQKVAEAEDAEDDSQAKSQNFRDSSFYIPYQSKDYHGEKGLGLETKSFAHELNQSVFSVEGDEDAQLRKNKHMIKWDRKKKRFINMSGVELSHKNKKIRTESGALIPASYKTDIYRKWKEHSKNYTVDMNDNQDDLQTNKKEIERRNRELESELKTRNSMGKNRKRPPRIAGLKSEEVILKDRLEKERREKRDKWRLERKRKEKLKSTKGKSKGRR